MSSVNAFLGVGDSDLVDVVNVGIYDNYSGGSFGGAIESSIAERESEAQNPSLSVNDMLGEDVVDEETYDYDINLGILFEISPKDSLNDVIDLSFENIEVTYSDGSLQKVEGYHFRNGSGELNKDKNYSFPVPYTLDQKLWNESIPLTEFYGNAHVKADMVINTSTETNKVIGHIDTETTPVG